MGFFVTISSETRKITDFQVELIPTLGALFPRGGPVLDPVITHHARLP